MKRIQTAEGIKPLLTPIWRVFTDEKIGMRKLTIVAMGMIALCGCASESASSVINDKSSADQADTKEWKEFVAPLSVKTQTPYERMMTRSER